MARETFSRGPNFVHPEKPSAVGSRNSINRGDRNEYEESKQIIDEEVDKVINHIHAKLPPEVLERLDVMGSVKSKLHNYFNQDFQNMLNRYIVTMEDEMAKKFRDLVDKEENKALSKYSPRGITDILERLGTSDRLNTAEMEHSIVNMYGHLQGHIERGVRDLESHTNSLLREKSDVGAFVQGDNSYAIVKCSFRDNSRRPKTVMDLKLSISILDSELISPIYHYQVPVTALIKDVVAKNIHTLIDQEIEKVNTERVEAGEGSMRDQDKIFEKFKALENYVSDSDDEVRYQFVAKRFLDAVNGIGAEIDAQDYDALGIRENIIKIIDNQNLRNRGFNTSVNAITRILDNSRMGYQFIENYKNARDCIIREYEDEDDSRLPDERYSIRLAYYDQEQLLSLREAYLQQVEELDNEVAHLWDVCEGIYKADRSTKGYDDWETLSDKMLNGTPAPEPQGKRGKRGEPDPEPVAAAPAAPESKWNEISFIAPEPTEVDKKNPTLEHKLSEIETRFPLMTDKMQKVFLDQNDEVRQVVERRLEFLKGQFEEFSNQINPFHIQPGLLLDIDITSIKKKQTTMKNMSNVINEFLYSVSKGFTDEIDLGLQGQNPEGQPQEFAS